MISFGLDYALPYYVPPLPIRVVAWPPAFTMLPEADPGVGHVPTDAGLFTFRNCALTCDNCLSYSHAAC